MSRWTAIVSGDQNSLAALSKVLPNPPFACTNENDRVAIAAKIFDEINESSEVNDIFTNLMSRLTAVIRIYAPDLNPVLKLDYLRMKKKDGGSVASITFNLSVIPAEPFSWLQTAHSVSGTNAMALLDFADSNERVQLALRIMSAPNFGWREIYDVIELISLKAIVTAGWANDSTVRAIRQTANHHRHLGGQKRNPLPETSPSLSDAHSMTTLILRNWIEVQRN